MPLKNISCVKIISITLGASAECKYCFGICIPPGINRNWDSNTFSVEILNKFTCDFSSVVSSSRKRGNAKITFNW